MRGLLRPVVAILWKDLLLELRTRDIVVSLVVFALLVVVLFNFALNPRPEVVAAVAPGVLWVAFSFAGVLGLNRSFALEKDRGNLEGLMLCPVGREVIYLGKLLTTFLFMVVMEALIFPIFAVLFNLPLLLPSFVLIALLATLGFAAVGTLFSAAAVNTRSREVMLPLLLFPVVVPLLIAAVEATGASLAGEGWGKMGRWLQLLAVFDVLFLVVAAFTFEFVLEE